MATGTLHKKADFVALANGRQPDKEAVASEPSDDNREESDVESEDTLVDPGESSAVNGGLTTTTMAAAHHAAAPVGADLTALGDDELDQRLHEVEEERRKIMRDEE